MKVLIVDDTNTDRLLLKLHLSKLGHQIVEADNGEKAIEQYSHLGNELDLILMDVQMPQMNGFDAVKQIRLIQKERNLAWVPIIFLSASADEVGIAQGIEAGGDDYLVKPIHQKALIEKMLSLQHIVYKRGTS